MPTLNLLRIILHSQPLHPVNAREAAATSSTALVARVDTWSASGIVVPPPVPVDATPTPAIIAALAAQSAVDAPPSTAQLSALSYTQQLHQQALLYALPSMYLMRAERDASAQKSVASPPRRMSRMQSQGALGAGLPQVRDG